MHHAAFRLVPLALASSLLTNLPGQDDADPAQAVRAERLTGQQMAADLPFRLEAGEIHIGELIDRVAAQLDHNYLVEPGSIAEAQSTIVLQSAAVFEDPEALEIFLGRMLWARGLVRVPFGEDDRTWEVLSTHGPRRKEISSRVRRMSADEVLAKRDHFLPVLCSLPLKHLSPNNASVAMRPLFSQSASAAGGLIVTSLGGEGVVAVQGLAPQVAAAVELLREADETAGDQQSHLKQRIENLTEQLQALAERVAKLEPTQAPTESSEASGQDSKKDD